MSHLLKRTKKSCLKLLRKISTSKQLFVQRLEEDDLSSNCNMTPTIDSISFDAITDDINDKQFDYDNHKTNDHSNKNEAVQRPDISNNDTEELQNEEDCANGIDYENNNVRLTARFFLGADGYDFQRLHQFHNIEWAPDLEAESVQSDKPHVQFERVPYKENVRYLRHTPSNSSLDLHQQSVKMMSGTEPEQQSFVVLSRPCSFRVGSKFDGHYQNVVITEPPHEYPVVKWDINGNEHKVKWNDFDSRWYQLQLQDKHQKRDSYSQRSSHQSSSCTLETWIDDTEPLSGRFDGLQNNNNNSNCNLCLKSF